MAQKKVYAVFGLGSFGQEVCRVLARKGGKVIAFDNQANLIDRIKDEVAQALLLDTTDEETLANAPLDDVDVAVVAIGNNVEASILTTALLKKIGVPYILARAISDIHLQVLKQVGADEVVNLEIEEGNRIAARLVATEVLDTIPISKEISLQEIYVPSPFVGKSPRDLELRSKYKVTIIAIKRFTTSVDDMGNPRRQEHLIFSGGDDVFESNDVLLIVGRNADLENLPEPQ